MRRITVIFGAAIVMLGSVQAAPPQASTVGVSSGAEYRAVLDRYCVTCHNDRLKAAGLLLDKMDVGNVPPRAETWEKVVRKLRSQAMPPAGAPRPDRGTYDSFATYLETELDRASAARPNPGRPATIHRLNRTEYANAIRDLLAVDIDAESLLPADESTYGFDNMGDVLSVSPVLLERYMSAAKKIGELAVGDSAIRPVFETYEVPKLLLQEDRMDEDLSFGSRGGVTIRHYFPADGEYVIRIRLQRNSRDYIRGLAEPHELEVSLDGARIKLFTVGGEHKGRSAGLFAYANDLGDPEQEEYERAADAGLEVRFPAKTGTALIGVAFQKETMVPEGAVQYINSRPDSLPRLTQADLIQYKGGDPAVESVIVGGPYETKGLGDAPGRRKIFVCRPTAGQTGGDAEQQCARKILSTLARRAYRRPATDADLQALLGLYDRGQKEGGFEAGIKTAIQGMLVSPEFIFRVERDPMPQSGIAPGTSYRISDLEIASRLSFFLWSSIPDDLLLDLASRGKLKDSEVLQQQVRRMLADPRAKALVSNFASEWLSLRNLRSVKPDPDVFPDFDESLRQAFEQETELFLESNLREDRSVTDLLHANYTFVNERLARHYGIPNIYGSHFRRIVLSDGMRGGLLGQGSILTVTSYANRTSPTIRGKWVLENILGAPPPPPPPNVPSLNEDKNAKALTMRQRMEQHRANPACATCHARMDPLGFALENFDATGKWQTTSGEAKTPIDVSGVLPDGAKFNGPIELRNLLLSRPEQFVNAFTEKLLTYALGRGIEYYDAPAIRKITREAAPGGYRWSSLILGIVNSAPFQMRRSREP